MNEESTGEYTQSPITLPEPTDEQRAMGLTTAYDVLNAAHMNDASDIAKDTSLPTEDELISPEQARLDNAESYRQEARNAQTKNLLDSLKSRMKPDKNSSNTDAKKRSEFKIRTGNDEATEQTINTVVKKREIKFSEQDARENDYIKNYIASSSNVRDIDMWLGYVNGSVKNGELRKDQLPDINKAAEERRSQLQEDTKNDYIYNYIATSSNVRDLNTWLGYVNGSVKNGELRKDQLPDINKAAEERRSQLQEDTMNDYINNYIATCTSVKDVDTWLGYVNGSVENGELRKDQLPKIINAAANRKLELE